MAELLDDALRAGSLGLSTNWFDTDRNRALVPSRFRRRRARHAARRDRPPPQRDVPGDRPRRRRDRRDVLERRARAGSGACRSATASAAARRRRASHLVPRWRQRAVQPHARVRDVDRRRRNPAVARDGERSRRRKLAHAGRPRVARRVHAHAWDDPLAEQNSFRHETLDSVILSDSENGAGPTGISLAELARAARRSTRRTRSPTG